MKSIGERINEALKLRGMKQSDLVNKTSIGKSSISTYISGEYEPKSKNIYKIAEALNVNESWLLGYDVPMEKTYHHNSCNDDIKNPQQETNVDKANFLANMSSYYDLLNKSGRKEALRRVYELGQLPQYNNAKRKENL